MLEQKRNLEGKRDEASGRAPSRTAIHAELRKLLFLNKMCNHIPAFKCIDSDMVACLFWCPECASLLFFFSPLLQYICTHNIFMHVCIEFRLFSSLSWALKVAHLALLFICFFTSTSTAHLTLIMSKKIMALGKVSKCCF